MYQNKIDKNAANKEMTSKQKRQNDTENETYESVGDDLNITEEERHFSSPKNEQFKTQIRRPEPRTTFKQNMHQYVLKLENSNQDTNFESTKKNPLYSTNFKTQNPPKNTDV